MSATVILDRCAKCGNTTALRRCSRCLCVAYCSPQCQKAHWKAGHSVLCKPPTVLNSRAAVAGGGVGGATAGGAAIGGLDSKTALGNAAAASAALLAASESWSTKVSSPIARPRRLNTHTYVGGHHHGGGGDDLKLSGSSETPKTATASSHAVSSGGAQGGSSTPGPSLSHNALAAAASALWASNSTAQGSASPAPFLLTSAGAPAFLGSPMDRSNAGNQSPSGRSRTLGNNSPASSSRSLGLSGRGASDGTSSPVNATRTLGLGLGGGGSTNSPASRSRTLDLAGGGAKALAARAMRGGGGGGGGEGGSSSGGGSGRSGSVSGDAPGTPSSAASAAAAKAGAPISVGTPQPVRVTAAVVANPFVTDWMEVRAVGGDRGNGWVARRDIPACTPLIIEFGVASSAFAADSEAFEEKAKDEIAFKLLRAKQAATSNTEREVFNLAYFKYLKKAKANAGEAVVASGTKDDAKDKDAKKDAGKDKPADAAAAAAVAAAKPAAAAADTKAVPATGPVPSLSVDSKDADIKVVAAQNTAAPSGPRETTGLFSADAYDELDDELSASALAAMDGITRYKSPFPALCDDVRWSVMKARVRTNVWSHDLPADQRAAFPLLATRRVDGTPLPAPPPGTLPAKPQSETKQRVLVVYPLISRFNHSCAPNVALLPSPTLVTAGVVFSLDAIKAGTELCLSYDDSALLQPTEQRRATLRDAHDFDCFCTRCTAGLAVLAAAKEGKADAKQPAGASAISADEKAAHALDVELERIVQPTHRTETPVMEREFVLAQELTGAMGVSTQHSIRAIQHLLQWRATWGSAFAPNHWRNIAIRHQLFDVFVALKRALPPTDTLPSKLLPTALDVMVEHLKALRDTHPKFLPRKRAYWNAAMEFGAVFLKKISTDEPDLYRHYLQLVAVFTKLEKPFRVGSAAPTLPANAVAAAAKVLADSNAAAAATVVAAPSASPETAVTVSA